jgi:DNA-binding beta-propeller fold protein YncE
MRPSFGSAAASALVAVVGACSFGNEATMPREPPSLRAVPTTSVRLVPIPDVLVAACRRAQRQVGYPFLCPARLPRPSRYYAPLTALALGASWARGAGTVDVTYAVGFASSFPRSNQPHEFLHFVIGRATEGIPRNARPALLGGRRGLLAPASSVTTYGGRYFANHVRFLWREHGIRYVATLHTFGERPTERLLGRILQTLRPARQLSRFRPGGPAAARVGVPPGPSELVLDKSGLYVTSRGTEFAPGSRVTRVDTRPLATTPLRRLPEHGTRLAVGEDRLWSAGSDNSPDPDFFTPPAVLRIDPESGGVEARLRLGRDRDTAATGIVVGAGSIWVALTDFDRNRDQGQVWRLDPDSGRVLAKVPVGRLPGAMAVEGESVWVVNARDSTISRIDAGTNRVETYDVASEPGGMVAANGSIWLTHPRNGTVSRIEPDSGRSVAVISSGGSAYGIAADARGVWIALPGAGAVRRIDPETNSVAETIETGGDPLAIAGDGHFLWVISSSDALVLRLRPGSHTSE